MKTVIVQFGQWESEVPVVDEVYDAIFHEGYMKGKYAEFSKVVDEHDKQVRADAIKGAEQ